MASMSFAFGIAWYFRWSWLPYKVVVPNGCREVSSSCRGGFGSDGIGRAAAFDNAIAAGGWFAWKLRPGYKMKPSELKGSNGERYQSVQYNIVLKESLSVLMEKQI